jgi:filamentous hemagglutinin family protein
LQERTKNTHHKCIKNKGYTKFLRNGKLLLAFMLFFAYNPYYMRIAKKKACAYFPLRRLCFFFVPILQLLFIPTTFANPLPLGHQAIHGNVSITQEGNILNIQSDNDKTISQWESFNISNGYTVNFFQPSRQSIHLNRVIGSNPSEIYGTLQSNGTVYLINPNGILVGPTGTINTYSGLLSTLDIANDSFIHHTNPTFIGQSAARIDILGKIHTSGDSFTILSQSIRIAPDAQIHAPNGRVQIASSDKIDLLIRPDDAKGTYIRVNASLDRPPSGTIDIAGQITAQEIAILSSGNPYAYAIRLHPEARLTAHGTETHPGTIHIRTENGSILQEGTITAPSGEAHLTAPQGKITHSGTINVSSPASSTEEIRRATSVRGGLIDILADEVELTALSRLLARGETDGGSIRVGGSWQGSDRALPHARHTLIRPAALIDASSINNGNGGTVVVWADNLTQFHGTILAQGADAGDGGRVEVSGRDYLDFFGHVSTRSASGHKGTLLLDPNNIEIINGTHNFPPGLNLDDPIWGANEDPTISTLSVSVLEAILKENTVTLDAKNDITINTPISWNSSSGLWITAGRHITVQAPITQITSESFSLGIHLQADTDNDGVGTLWIRSPITQAHSDINLVAADIRIDAPVTVHGIGGQITALALHGAIDSSLTTPALSADFIDLSARDGIYGALPSDPLTIAARFSISAENTSAGDVRLHNATNGTHDEYIFVDRILAPQGTVYLAQTGGSSLYLGNIDAPFTAKAANDITIRLTGDDPSANIQPNLIINRSINAGGNLVAISDGNITINPTATVGTDLITGGRVTLSVGDASPSAFAQATLTNNGIIESGSDLHIHAASETRVTLGTTNVAGQTHILPYRYSDTPPTDVSNAGDFQNSSSQQFSTQKSSSESHRLSSSSHSFSSSGQSFTQSSQQHQQSSSSFSSSSARMESFRSDFSRSSQNSSSGFSSAISQASYSSSSYFSSRYSHSVSHSGPLTQSAQSSSAYSMSLASSSSLSNFTANISSASNSSASHFSLNFPTFSLHTASKQFSTPPPAVIRFTGDANPLAADIPQATRYTLSQDSNKLWLSPFYNPDQIMLSAEYLYPDSAIAIGDRSESLSFNLLPESLTSALSSKTRLLLNQSLSDEDPLPEPTPPRRRLEKRPVTPPPAGPARKEEKEKKKKEEKMPILSPPTPAYGSGVVLTDKGTSIPMHPGTIPESLKKALSKATRANLQEAIIADDY